MQPPPTQDMGPRFFLGPMVRALAQLSYDEFKQFTDEFSIIQFMCVSTLFILIFVLYLEHIMILFEPNEINYYNFCLNQGINLLDF